MSNPITAVPQPQKDRRCTLVCHPEPRKHINTDSQERKKTALDAPQWELPYFQLTHTCRPDPKHSLSAGSYTPKKQTDLQGLDPPTKLNTESVLYLLHLLQLLHTISKFSVLTEGIFQFQGLPLEGLLHILALFPLLTYLKRMRS